MSPHLPPSDQPGGPVVPSRDETPVHTAYLVERHQVSFPYVFGDDARGSELLIECRRQAEQWLREQGLEERITSFVDPKTAMVGVRWDVVIGKSTAPGSEWTWSARWRYWLRRFRGMNHADPGVVVGDSDVSCACVDLDDYR